MKLNPDFSLLKQCVEQMGAKPVHIDIKIVHDNRDLELATQLSSRIGVEIDLSQLTTHEELLSWEGFQIVLFMPMHRLKDFSQQKYARTQLNRYHFAECQKIREMKAKGRFDGVYHAVQNVSGEFEITDGNNKVNEALLPCRYCLSHINYKNYKHLTAPKRTELVENLKIYDLFSTYSTLFKLVPNTKPKQGYTSDWADVSNKYRASKNYCCESCGVELSGNKSLLHTHHINRNKQDNRFENLQALCMDCHRKQPYHEHLLITRQQMQDITDFRRAQGLLDDISSWKNVYEYADEAVHGLLHHYEKVSPKYKPEVGFKVTDDRGAVVAELELAWPQLKKGIALEDDDMNASLNCGWKVLSIGQAIEKMNQRN
jgi:hypothetical protein